MRKLVCGFYDGLNFGQLVKQHGESKPLITDILIGDFFKDGIDALWPLMDQSMDASMDACTEKAGGAACAEKTA